MSRAKRILESGDMLQYLADKERAKKTGKFVDRGHQDYNPKTDRVEPGRHKKHPHPVDKLK